jgi:AcrR family transcriptional regulator
MARTQDSVAETRRKPHQARAVDTVETIFEATARIIERDGVDARNTNRSAEHAGVAIGTRYGY